MKKSKSSSYGQRTVLPPIKSLLPSSRKEGKNRAGGEKCEGKSVFVTQGCIIRQKELQKLRQHYLDSSPLCIPK